MKFQKIKLRDVIPPDAPYASTSIQLDELSNDGRRVKRKAAQAQLPSPVKKSRMQTSSGHRGRTLEDSPEIFTSILETYENENPFYVDDSTKVQNVELLIGTAAARAPRRYLTSDQPLLEWKKVADDYLLEMIRNEGRGDGSFDSCFCCRRTSKDRVPLFRCMDCFPEDLVCEHCCRELHEFRPLDMIEQKWNGKFFERVSLKSIGVFVQLGHKARSVCPTPKVVDNFTVIHVNGIHTIRLHYCGCPNRLLAGEWWQQLLRCRWFPATHIEPQTAATYRVMNMFHVLTLQGKVTTYDFYAGLEKMTDNAALINLPDRYRSFSRMMKEWRHLKMAKRSGRGNDAERTLAETKSGEMGIKCPACPRPDVNLPANWREAPPKKRYLYWIFFAIDACFRLKRRLVSSEARDPDLDDGVFREYLRAVTDQNEMSTCTGLSALDHANTKHSRGYATTGVGIGVCARHEFIQLNGAVDLQKGERYANMDYAFASFLRHHDSSLTKIISYDIACQWYKNVVRRVKALPSLVACDLGLQNIKFAIPKLHIHGHQLACQLKFSLNWLRGAGRTDGEGVERPWAHLGPMASSTRDMGPGSRHGTMNDHFGHWNWVKLIGLGALLRKRHQIALKEFKTQNESLNEFTQGKGDETIQWKKRIEDWEEDQDKPEAERTVANPYELPKTGLTEHDVWLRLSEEEARQAANGSFSLHEVGPTAFMSQLLELEDQQRTLSLDISANTFETASQKTSLMERRTKLMRLMGRIRSIQALYMPAAIQILGQRRVDGEEHAENVPIIFPSNLSNNERSNGCHADLAKIEEQLRDAQIRGALDSLRNHLHMKTRLLTYRKSNVKAQSTITKSQALLKRNQRQIDSDVQRYRTAWHSLEQLRGVGNSGWNKLRLSDVRTMDGGEDRALGMARKRVGKKKRDADAAHGSSSDDLDLYSTDAPDVEEADDGTALQRARNGVGEGFRETSWIWKEGGNGNLIDDHALEEFMRVEWSKSYSRVQRWKEELALLEEERRRVLVSLEHEAQQWDARQMYEGPLSAKSDDKHREGARAYALSQAHLYRQIARNFCRLWNLLESEVVVDAAAGEMDSASEDEEEDEAGIFGDDDMADIPEDDQ
ncbi:hypothetical protein F5880DRAFT_1625783 [Lentinula raphanica]|nr:hypothetical protein F5880DRAFT_1625783 [Lentinula raphanica]